MSVSDELYASYENGREAGIASAREAFDAERAAYESKIIEIEARRVDDAEIITTLEAENAKLRAESREFRGMDASVGISDPCPSCGQSKLFVGTGGHLTCSGSKCKSPCAIGDVAEENAKLRDLLRRVLKIDEEAQSAEDVDDALMELCNEIKSAIEPGNPGEVKP